MLKINKFLLGSLCFVIILFSFVSASSVTRYVGTVAEVNGGDVSFKVNDRLGSQRVIVDEQGEVEAEFKSLPYGQSVVDNGSKYGFTGKEEDASSGLHYFGARYYISDAGRFIGVDPVASNHPYSYVANDPMNYVDPTGMEIGLLPSDETSENLFIKPENSQKVIDDLNSFFEEDLFYMNDEGYVEPTETYSGGTNDQNLLYGIIMDVILHPEIVKVAISDDFFDSRFVVANVNKPDEKKYVFAGECSNNENSFAYAEHAEDIGIVRNVILIHELAHVRGYLLTPDKKNELTYGETIAVTAENVARRILDLEERKYYFVDNLHGIEVINEEYVYKLYGLTPYEYDKNKEPVFIGFQEVFD